MKLSSVKLILWTTSRQLGRMAFVALVAAALQAKPQDAQATSSCIDVALVLSIDGSGSISPEEYLFQQRAVAAALRDQEVQRTMARAGTVALSAVFWGTAGTPVDYTPWTIIHTPGDAEKFAKWFEQQPRKVNGNTGLGAGLAAALAKFSSLGACANRMIINVSGDGSETPTFRQERRSARPEQVKAQAEAMGVAINALVISDEEQNLPQYYAERVITGPAAFVMELHTYSDYADALKRKLIRELGPNIISRAD